MTTGADHGAQHWGTIMKKREDIQLYVSKQLEELLAYADPGNTHDILDVMALAVLGDAKYLAGTSSRGQAVQALQDMAKHIETVPDLPKVKIVFKETRH